MRFENLSERDQTRFIKRYFMDLVADIFNHPTKLKSLITDKKILEDDASKIFKALSKLNKYKCHCCRLYDQSKLKLMPIEKELQPLIDVAKDIAKSKNY